MNKILLLGYLSALVTLTVPLSAERGYVPADDFYQSCMQQIRYNFARLQEFERAQEYVEFLDMVDGILPFTASQYEKKRDLQLTDFCKSTIAVLQLLVGDDEPLEQEKMLMCWCVGLLAKVSVKNVRREQAKAFRG